MTNNILTVHIPYNGEESVSNIERILVRTSYHKIFWHSFAPPHKVEYAIRGLSDEGVENWKSRFRETVKNYIEPQWLSHCNFTVENVDDKKQ